MARLTARQSYVRNAAKLNGQILEMRPVMKSSRWDLRRVTVNNKTTLETF